MAYVILMLFYISSLVYGQCILKKHFAALLFLFLFLHFRIRHLVFKFHLEILNIFVSE